MKRLDANRLLIPREGNMEVDAVIYASDAIRIEDDAVRQLMDAASLPTVHKCLATPDIHVGYGVPIGCVVGFREIVVPAAVGYDVNCGMRVLTTPVKRGEVDPAALAHSIRRDVPLGEGKSNLRLSVGELDVVLARGVSGVSQIAESGGLSRCLGLSPESGRTAGRSPDWEAEVAADLAHIEDRGSMPANPDAVSARAKERGKSQLGTLGGGNHFIEIQAVDRVEDESLARRWGIVKDGITVMIHSGSRGLGHQVGDDYMNLASRLTGDVSPNRHLAWLDASSREGKNYVGAMYAAANFAFVNREIMTLLVRRNLRQTLGDVPLPIVYDVPHNMAKFEEHEGLKLWVHRKGATRAFPPERMQGTPFADVGQPVLIPGSMGTASYILVGTPESRATYYSVNHGAGRTMSRLAAAGGRHGRHRQGGREAAISDEDFARAMKGITLITEDRRAAKEEAPQAYKDIDEVVRIVVAAGLARVVARLVPLAVLKG